MAIMFSASSMRMRLLATAASMQPHILMTWHHTSSGLMRYFLAQ